MTSASDFLLDPGVTKCTITYIAKHTDAGLVLSFSAGKTGCGSTKQYVVFRWLARLFKVGEWGRGRTEWSGGRADPGVNWAWEWVGGSGRLCHWIQSFLLSPNLNGKTQICVCSKVVRRPIGAAIARHGVREHLFPSHTHTHTHMHPAASLAPGKGTFWCSCSPGH